MEENNKLKISDYLTACIDFEETQNEEKLKDINTFLGKLNFREYIPLKEKEMLIMKIMSSVGKDFDAPGASAFVEMSKISVGLFAYCTNLEVDVGFFNSLYHAYDLLHQFGFVETALKRCHTDYEVLLTMLDRALSFDNFYRIIQTASLFDSESYDKWINTMNDLKTTMNQDTLKELMNVTNPGDEVSQEILRDMQNAAVREANEELAQEQKKIRNAIKTIDKNSSGDANESVGSSELDGN